MFKVETNCNANKKPKIRFQWHRYKYIRSLLMIKQV